MSSKQSMQGKTVGVSPVDQTQPETSSKLPDQVHSSGGDNTAAESQIIGNLAAESHMVRNSAMRESRISNLNKRINEIATMKSFLEQDFFFGEKEISQIVRT